MMTAEEQEDVLILLRKWFEDNPEQKMNLYLHAWSDEKKLIEEWLG